jgi:hypothetical protein
MKKLFLLTFALTLLCTWVAVSADTAPTISAKQPVLNADNQASDLARNVDREKAKAEKMATLPAADISVLEGYTEPYKAPYNGPIIDPDPNLILQGGDTFGDVIAAVPYTDGGTTCGYTDDYDYSCMFGGPPDASPDVVYSYTPEADICVDITLCNGPLWDTGLSVHDGAYPSEIACSEDVCGLTSEILGLELTGGVTYYIIIDGYDRVSGRYFISVLGWPEHHLG